MAQSLCWFQYFFSFGGNIWSLLNNVLKLYNTKRHVLKVFQRKVLKAGPYDFISQKHKGIYKNQSLHTIWNTDIIVLWRNFCLFALLFYVIVIKWWYMQKLSQLCWRWCLTWNQKTPREHFFEKWHFMDYAVEQY